MKLKILSLWQPHATLCVTPSKENPMVPAKPVETRSWTTHHRGWLGIHSAMMKAPTFKHLCKAPSFRKYVEDFDKLPFGYILGMVYISGCYPTNSQALKDFAHDIATRDGGHRMAEILAFGDFSDGRYGFTISAFERFASPVRATGSQGFWFHEMPNHIGEPVHMVFSEQFGKIVNYDESHHGGNKYKIILTDGSSDWYSEAGFKVPQKEPKLF